MAENVYDATVSAEMERHRAAYEAAVEVALSKLEDDPTCKRSLSRRRQAIRAIVDAEVDPSRSRESLWVGGRAADAAVPNRSTFFSKRSKWMAHPPFVAVLDEVLRLAREWEQKRSGREREARRVAHQERMLNISSKMLEKAEAMMQFPLSEQTIDTNTGTVVVAPARWDYRSLSTAVSTADKAARLALEMDTKRETQTVETWQDRVVELLKNGEISAEDVEVAYPDQAREMLAAAGIKRTSDEEESDS